eukprot:CAMPEP_0201501632 /NCGR_PEP_ID=MMETSP0151_2-20130828/83691_1 /ASSEMBLY_ACC=CAM_ASM_000257 /TAXON_ID=200890 /ORGANISM="Paramoeba atlantica, Strain 621/1 / CCAP 1560/9" /LENGTH=434 /DNA_ID=CAMNT_0047895151 /DNA_START=67 /DNA_END=1371 /DNA_ORIENTATION=+
MDLAQVEEILEKVEEVGMLSSPSELMAERIATQENLGPVDQVNRYLLSSFRHHLADGGQTVGLTQGRNLLLEGEEDQDGWDEEYDDTLDPFRVEGQNSPSSSSSSSSSSFVSVSLESSVSNELNEFAQNYCEGNISKSVSLLLKQFSLSQQFLSSSQSLFPSSSSFLSVAGPKTEEKIEVPQIKEKGEREIFKVERKREEEEEEFEEEEFEDPLAALVPKVEINAIWEKYFEQKGIIKKNPAFGMAALSPPSLSVIQSCVQDLSFSFMFQVPQDYLSFCSEMGGGILGRCRLFVPTEEMNQFDLRSHTYRLQELFSSPQYDKSTSRRELVIFARDVEEDCWFGWKRGERDEVKREFIFCVDESEKSPPPIRIAKDFTDFVNTVCFGNKMKKLGIRKIPVNPDRMPDTMSSDDEDDEDGQEERPLYFKPFPAPPL